jgi:hypothetical protein
MPCTDLLHGIPFMRELIQTINFVWVSLKVLIISHIRLQFPDNQHGSQYEILQNLFNAGNTTGISRHNQPHMYSIYTKNTQ